MLFVSRGTATCGFVIMKFVCLGTGGYYSTEENQTMSYMLPELGIILDAGSGLYRAKNYIMTETVDIFITHTHLDHILGIYALKMLYKNEKLRNLRIHAKQDVIDSIKILSNPPFSGSNRELCMIPLENDPVTLENGAIISFFNLNHKETPCIGFRIDANDKKFAYITDTTSNENSAYVKNVCELDLLVHECYYHDDNIESTFGHTSSAGLVSFCKATNNNRVIIVHHNPNGGKDEILSFVKQHIPDIELGIDNQVYEF